MTSLMAVSREWQRRPPDERFLTLDSLRESVAERTRSAAVMEGDTKDITVSTAGDELFVRAGNFEDGKDTTARFTNWSMGQLATICGAPAGYLSRLPAAIAADCLNHGIKTMQREKNLLLFTKNHTDEVTPQAEGNVVTLARNVPNNVLRAVTSTSYGRIWDIQVVDSIIMMNIRANERWVVPAASYKSEEPKRATTIYGSDRDVFIFLCDPQHPIAVNGKPKFRGFYVYNSEVGSQVLGVATFLYDCVCDNRIIWGVEGFVLMKRRHTSLAPAWFMEEGQGILDKYAESAASREEEVIRKANTIQLGSTPEDVLEFLTVKTNFGKRYAMEAITYAERVEGNPTLLWNVVSGLTAVARNIPHTDTRVGYEIEAGRLLNMAA
mgnify:CR=1 FL=1